MISGKKIKVTKELYARLESAAERMRCSSVEEFAAMILGREADKVLAEDVVEVSQAEVDDIKDKLKGLGYLE